MIILITGDGRHSHTPEGGRRFSGVNRIFAKNLFCKHPHATAIGTFKTEHKLIHF